MRDATTLARGLAIWVVPFVIAVAAIGIETDWGRSLNRDTPVPAAAPPQPVAVALLPEYRIEGGVDARRETVDRVLFNPTRRPAPPASQAAGGASAMQARPVHADGHDGRRQRRDGVPARSERWQVAQRSSGRQAERRHGRRRSAARSRAPEAGRRRRGAVAENRNRPQDDRAGSAGGAGAWRRAAGRARARQPSPIRPAPPPVARPRRGRAAARPATAAAGRAAGGYAAARRRQRQRQRAAGGTPPRRARRRGSGRRRWRGDNATDALHRDERAQREARRSTPCGVPADPRSPIRITPRTPRRP